MSFSTGQHGGWGEYPRQVHDKENRQPTTHVNRRPTTHVRPITSPFNFDTRRHEASGSVQGNLRLKAPHVGNTPTSNKKRHGKFLVEIQKGKQDATGLDASAIYRDGDSEDDDHVTSALTPLRRSKV